MKRHVLALIFACLSCPALAQDFPPFPALYHVTGLGSGEALDIRTDPYDGADAVGSLPSGARNVEIVTLSDDGEWGLVSSGEISGWVAMQHLESAGLPSWVGLGTPLSCLGTEPFWNLRIEAPLFKAAVTTPDGGEKGFTLRDFWPGSDFRPVAALRIDPAAGGGFAVLRGDICSDGMSDRAYGIAVDIFPEDSGSPSVLSGCCTLQP